MILTAFCIDEMKNQRSVALSNLAVHASQDIIETRFCERTLRLDQWPGLCFYCRINQLYAVAGSPWRLFRGRLPQGAGSSAL